MKLYETDQPTVIQTILQSMQQRILSRFLLVMENLPL